MNKLLWKFEEGKDTSHLPSWVEKVVGILGIIFIFGLTATAIAPVLGGVIWAGTALFSFMAVMYAYNKSEEKFYGDNIEELCLYDNGIYVHRGTFYKAFFAINDIELDSLTIQKEYWQWAAYFPVFVKNIVFIDRRISQKIKIPLNDIFPKDIESIEKIIRGYKKC